MKKILCSCSFSVVFILLASLAGHTWGDFRVEERGSAAVDSPATQPLTGALLQASPRGKEALLAGLPALVDGKAFSYPPTTLREARDERRVDPGVSVRVVHEKSVYRVLEPITIRVEVRNDSGEHKWREVSTSPYKVVHTNAYQDQRYNGSITPKTLYERRSGDVGMAGAGCGADLPPGRLDRYEIIVNLSNDLTWPGEYSFFVEFYTGGVVEIDGKVTPRVARSRECKVSIVDLPRTVGP